MDKHVEVMVNTHGMSAAPGAPQMFGNAGREHMQKYGMSGSYVAEDLPNLFYFDISILLYVKQ